MLHLRSNQVNTWNVEVIYLTQYMVTFPCKAVEGNTGIGKMLQFKLKNTGGDVESLNKTDLLIKLQELGRDFNIQNLENL